jgi:hypothetical protein
LGKRRAHVVHAFVRAGELQVRFAVLWINLNCSRVFDHREFVAVVRSVLIASIEMMDFVLSALAAAPSKQQHAHERASRKQATLSHVGISSWGMLDYTKAIPIQSRGKA